MELPEILKQHWSQVTALCQQYDALRLCAFGSVITDRVNLERSDPEYF